MEKYEIVKYNNDFTNRISELEIVIKPVELENLINDLENQMSSDNFWNDSITATKIINESNNYKNKLVSFLELKNLVEELDTIVLLDDESLYLEAEELIKTISEKMNSFETIILLNGECDHLPCILEIHPGAGGTESQDWALMLFRMYKRFAEEKGFKFSVLDYLEASDAGIKSVTCLVEGLNAYGLLQSERGVHRLVRISPFDSNARRHTSFAAVGITPQIDDQVEVVINPEDIRIDTYRSSGAGGQHVNTTDSAVRITHLPTNIVVSCQNERSQIQNKEQAMKVLKAKLYQLKIDEKNEMIKETVGGTMDNAFGSQIRSYVLHPYSMVKDHRTSIESSNPIKVLDGELDIFINAFLKSLSLK
jgi:peptide chain release factor 2